MPTIQIVMNVEVAESFVKDRSYWLFRWQLDNKKVTIKERLDKYNRELASLIFQQAGMYIEKKDNNNNYE